MGTHLDVMSTILHDSIGRAIGTAQLTQLVKHLHPFVEQVDRRLEFALPTSRPFLVELSPVLRPCLAPALIAEIPLIL